MQVIAQRVQVPKILQDSLYWNQEQQVTVDDKIRFSTGEVFALSEMEKVIKILSSWSPFWAYTDCSDFIPQTWDYLIKRLQSWTPDIVPIINQMQEDDVLYLGEATLNQNCCGGLISKTLISSEQALEIYNRLKAVPSTLPYGAVLDKIK